MMDYRLAGLRQEEYEEIKRVLGREPNENELRIMGVMWSEHCSYKSTKHLLRNFPTTGEKVILGPGENAGPAPAVQDRDRLLGHPGGLRPPQRRLDGLG